MLRVLPCAILALTPGILAGEPHSGGLWPPFKLAWQFPPPSARLSGLGDIVLAGNALYYGTGQSYGALDAATGSPIWEQRFDEDHDRTRVACDGTTLCVAASDGRLIVCDARGGREMWSLPTKGLPGPMLVRGETVYLERRHGELTALSAGTGKARWRFPVDPRHVCPSGTGCYGTLGGLHFASGSLFTTTGRRLICVDTGKGRVRWQWPPDATSGLRVAVVGSNARFLFVRLWPERSDGTGSLVAMRLHRGGVVWKRQIERSSAVLAADGLIATWGPDEFLRVLRASDGLELWSRKVRGEFDAAIAFDAGVFVVYTVPCIRAFAADGTPLWQWDAYVAYSNVSELARCGDGFLILAGGVSCARLTTGEDEPSPEKVTDAIAVLSDRGRKVDARTWDSLDLLCRSHDPQAVAYLIGQLQNPSAPPAFRRAAYQNVARIGGRAGAAAVLRGRDERRTHLPLKEYVRFDELSPDDVGKPLGERPVRLLETKTDAAGQVWGLFWAPVLGRDYDSWIAKRGPEGWTDLRLTGVESRKLVKTDWLTAFSSDSNLTRDTDGDGLTDVIERRIGTRLDLADSDGDGLSDAVDCNPLVAPRELSEEEQVLAAAFGACFNFTIRRSPALVRFPKGMKPFELCGWNWIVVPEAAESTRELACLVGTGTDRVSFLPPSEDFGFLPMEHADTPDIILWGKDRTEAKLSVYDYFGNVGAVTWEVHLRKIEGQWTSIRVRVTMVS